MNSITGTQATSRKVGGANKSQHIDDTAFDVEISDLNTEQHNDLLGPTRVWGSDYHKEMIPD